MTHEMRAEQDFMKDMQKNMQSSVVFERKKHAQTESKRGFLDLWLSTWFYFNMAKLTDI